MQVHSRLHREVQTLCLCVSADLPTSGINLMPSRLPELCILQMNRMMQAFYTLKGHHVCYHGGNLSYTSWYYVTTTYYCYYYYYNEDCPNKVSEHCLILPEHRRICFHLQAPPQYHRLSLHVLSRVNCDGAKKERHGMIDILSSILSFISFLCSKTHHRWSRYRDGLWAEGWGKHYIASF